MSNLLPTQNPHIFKAVASENGTPKEELSHISVDVSDGDESVFSAVFTHDGEYYEAVYKPDPDRSGQFYIEEIFGFNGSDPNNMNFESDEEKELCELLARRHAGEEIVL